MYRSKLVFPAPFTQLPRETVWKLRTGSVSWSQEPAP
jgi:hypothetical protein